MNQIRQYFEHAIQKKISDKEWAFFALVFFFQARQELWKFMRRILTGMEPAEPPFMVDGFLLLFSFSRCFWKCHHAGS